MKRNDKKELYTKDKNELQAMLKTFSGYLENFKMEHSLGRLKNPRSIFFARKQIAIIKTFLKGKENK